jgi:diguanylate cyclase (GGDEF)-like protein
VIAQIFAAVSIFTMFPVAALLEEKDALKNSLATSEARFRDLAYVDELTRLPNRRAFNLHLDQAWAAAMAGGWRLALLILDVDQFKQYNDDVGHPEGDASLCLIGRTIAGIVDTANGFAARIGGEEFAVLLPDATQQRARELAEEIRLSVVGLALAHSSTPCGVQTVSIGVALLVPQTGQVPIDLMKQADQALYSAKRSGRNQVACG